MSSRQFRITVLPQAVRRRRGVAAASALTSGPGGRSQSTVPGSGGRPTVDCGGTYAPVEGRGTLEGAGGRKLHAARRSAGGGSPWPAPRRARPEVAAPPAGAQRPERPSGGPGRAARPRARSRESRRPSALPAPTCAWGLRDLPRPLLAAPGPGRLAAASAACPEPRSESGAHGEPQAGGLPDLGPDPPGRLASAAGPLPPSRPAAPAPGPYLGPGPDASSSRGRRLGVGRTAARAAPTLPPESGVEHSASPPSANEEDSARNSTTYLRARNGRAARGAWGRRRASPGSSRVRLPSGGTCPAVGAQAGGSVRCAPSHLLNELTPLISSTQPLPTNISCGIQRCKAASPATGVNYLAGKRTDRFFN
ncbi:uncharacterized protein [Manis javanica]|uniref:uncharacterized protein n=1 Tax=Manis javanica TaxID=9974 RepID=UPI003C6D520D